MRDAQFTTTMITSGAPVSSLTKTLPIGRRGVMQRDALITESVLKSSTGRRTPAQSR
jgi:hypothetical protein